MHYVLNVMMQDFYLFHPQCRDAKFCVSKTADAFSVIGRDNLGDAKYCVSTVGGGVSFVILCLVVEAPVGGRCAGDGLEDAVEGGFVGETR